MQISGTLSEAGRAEPGVALTQCLGTMLSRLPFRAVGGCTIRMPEHKPLGPAERDLSEGDAISELTSMERKEVLRAELPPRTEEPAAVRGGSARRGRILIVDDEPRLAQSLRMLLESAHDVVATTRGSEALELVSSGQPFDLVVCDLQMPGTSGMDIYARLREQAPELAQRLVFMSGGAYTPAASAFIRSVPNRVLEKPVRPEVLLATVDAVLAPGALRARP